VYDHIVDRPTPTANELRRAAPDLEVHPARDVPPRARVVVLDELADDTRSLVDVSAIGLGEETALVAEHARLDQLHVRELALDDLHGTGSLRASAAERPHVGDRVVQQARPDARGAELLGLAAPADPHAVPQA